VSITRGRLNRNRKASNSSICTVTSSPTSSQRQYRIVCSIEADNFGRELQRARTTLIHSEYRPKVIHRFSELLCVRDGHDWMWPIILREGLHIAPLGSFAERQPLPFTHFSSRSNSSKSSVFSTHSRLISLNPYFMQLKLKYWTSSEAPVE
jgi:hypothetical protein